MQERASLVKSKNIVFLITLILILLFTGTACKRGPEKAAKPLELVALLHQDSKKVEEVTVFTCDIRIPQIKETNKTEYLVKINDFYMDRFNQVVEIECKEAANETLTIYLDYLEGLENSSGDYSFGIAPYSIDKDFHVNYNDKGFLSLSIMESYYWGGAHPISFIDSQTFDINAGQMLTLGKLFKTDEASALNLILNKISQQIIEAGTEELYLFDEALEILHESFYEEDFFIDGQDLVLYFQSYAIAPYSSGFPEFRIPLEELPYFNK